MTSSTGKQTIITHILLSVSRNKGNQMRKCGQSIEYNRNIFLLKNHTQIFGGEVSLRPFSKKPKLSIFLVQQFEFYTVCFYCMSKSRSIKIYLKFVSATFLLFCFLIVLRNQEKCFLFHFKSSFPPQENQSLEFQMFKFHDVIKCQSIKKEIHFTE